MQSPNGAKGSEKAFIGDWAETPEGAEAYVRSTQAMKEQMGAFLQFFCAAFPSSIPTRTDEQSSHRVSGRCLDIGCGPGGFTVIHLLRCLPAWCKNVVVVDNSDAMLQLAREKEPHPQVEYNRLDIIADEDVARFCAKEGCFGMVSSFGCLHWIADQHKAFGNIEKLMAHGGECFVIFAGSLLIFDLFVAITESARWKKYAEHIRKVVPATHGMDKVAMRSYAASLLDSVNLTALSCEVFSYSLEVGVTVDELAELYTKSNPIYSLLSDVETEELRSFTHQFLQESTKKNSGKLLNNCTRIAIHAYKP